MFSLIVTYCCTSLDWQILRGMGRKVSLWASTYWVLQRGKDVMAEGCAAPVKSQAQYHFCEPCMNMHFRNVSLKSESNLRGCLDTTSRVSSIKVERKQEPLEKY